MSGAMSEHVARMDSTTSNQMTTKLRAHLGVRYMHITGNATDALGQIYEPDTSNIMSYSPDVCTDFFSQEQYAMMYAGYHVFRGTYYKCPSFNVKEWLEKNGMV